MPKLEYTFKNDALFKMLFVQYPELLKRLVSKLLDIEIESIGEFEITNPDILPDNLGEKFCRLDINMTISGQRVDLEIQVSDEGDYPERSLYYWAREYSSALVEGQDYLELPRVVIVSILGFRQFDCEEFHSEYQALEVRRHTPLTNRQSLHYFELPKLPKVIGADDELKLWLSLFNAQTEEDLKRIEAMEVAIMEQAIGAYRRVTATDQFKELERLRSLARHNEAAALRHARQEAMREVEEKWQGVVADKDAALADKDALIAALRAQLGQTH